MLGRTRACECSAEEVTDDLFSLDGLWQERFLRFVAHAATRRRWDGRLPTREEVVTWLTGNSLLCRKIRLMLHVWGGTRPADKGVQRTG